MALAQFIGAEAKALHGAGSEILHQHVSLRDELGEDLAADRTLDVDRQRALATVWRDKERGELPSLVDGGAAAAGDVAADRLDLEHVGALVCQKHGRERARDHARQIEHANAVEWTGHDILLELRSAAVTIIHSGLSSRGYPRDADRPRVAISGRVG